MAVFSLAAMILGLPALSGGLLLAGFLAMMLDYDESEDHSGHSPWTHSIILAVTVTATVSVVSWVVATSWDIPFAIAAAFGTHLGLDLFSEGGIYSWPRRSGRGWRWRMIHYRLRYGDDDPWYNLCATAPAIVGLVLSIAH